jgi:polyisoprenoid-binding protein YceI
LVAAAALSIDTAPVAAVPHSASAQQQLGPRQWRIDPSHSAANFSVRHLMVSTVRGQLGRVSGIVEYDGKDVRSIRADVTIDVNGITTQNEKRDGHLRSADFFDTATHPTITFTSKRVEPGASGAFKLVGDLTIRGTTKEVVLDAEPPAPVVKGMAGLVTGTTATTRIKRLEYGLKYNAMVEAGPVVGDDVTITIDVEIGRPTPPV